MDTKHLHSCKRATVLMSKSFEEKLSLREHIALFAHLAMCKTCTYCFRQLKALQKVFVSYTYAISAVLTPPNLSLSEEACARIKTALRENSN